MRPVGSVFLLRAASDVSQQSNPSMAVSCIRNDKLPNVVRAQKMNSIIIMLFFFIIK